MPASVCCTPKTSHLRFVWHPQFLLGISEDITSRKALEDQIRHHANELEAEVDRRATRIQELEQRRMQVEKLAALSQIAAGVAHEINNPLASIAQALTLVKRAIPRTTRSSNIPKNASMHRSDDPYYPATLHLIPTIDLPA